MLQPTPEERVIELEGDLKVAYGLAEAFEEKCRNLEEQYESVIAERDEFERQRNYDYTRFSETKKALLESEAERVRLLEQYEGMAQAYREQRGMREMAEMRLAESVEQLEATQDAMIAHLNEARRLQAALWEIATPSQTSVTSDLRASPSDIAREALESVSFPATRPLPGPPPPGLGIPETGASSPAINRDDEDACGDCGHPHVNGRTGSCSKFSCDCREWVAPVAFPASSPQTHERDCRCTSCSEASLSTSEQEGR